MAAVDFVWLPKSSCYRLNKHPNLTLAFFSQWESIPETAISALEKSLWKVMQIKCLVQCSCWWHKAVAKNIKSMQSQCESYVLQSWIWGSFDFLFVFVISCRCVLKFSGNCRNSNLFIHLFNNLFILGPTFHIFTFSHFHHYRVKQYKNVYYYKMFNNVKVLILSMHSHDPRNVQVLSFSETSQRFQTCGPGTKCSPLKSLVLDKINTLWIQYMRVYVLKV